MPVQCQQCENPPCVRGLPGRRHLEEKDGIVVIDYDWCIGCRCCVAACPYGARHFNWGEPVDPGGGGQPEHALPRQPPAAARRRREVHVLHPARPQRPLSGVRGDLPGRCPQVREPARPEERDPLPARAQAGLRPQSRAEDASRSSSTSTASDVSEGTRIGVLRFLVQARRDTHCAAGRSTGSWLAFLLSLVVWGALAYSAARRRADRHRDARPGVVGVLHRQLHLPRRRGRRGGRSSSSPRIIYHWKPIKEVAILARDPGDQRHRDVLALRTGGHGAAGSRVAFDPRHGLLNVPSSLLAWDVVASERLSRAEHRHRRATCSIARINGRHVREGSSCPLVLLSIPAAIAHPSR